MTNADASTSSIDLSLGETIALSTARWIAKEGAIPMDERGQLTGWHRLQQGGQTWYGNALTDQLNPSDPLTFEFVENQQECIQFEHHTRDGIISFELVVGLATTVQFILKEIRNRRALTEPDWGLWINGIELGPWQLLSDYAPFNWTRIVLRQRGPTP